MTVAIRDSRTIPAAPDTVWSTLTDWARAPEWMPGVSAMTAGGPLAAGTELGFTAEGKPQLSTITEVDPGRSITLSSARGGVTADYRYTLEPDPAGGTRIELVADVTTSGAMKLLGGVIRGAIAKVDGPQLERFAALF